MSVDNVSDEGIKAIATSLLQLELFDITGCANISKINLVSNIRRGNMRSPHGGAMRCYYHSENSNVSDNDDD